MSEDDERPPADGGPYESVYYVSPGLMRKDLPRGRFVYYRTARGFVDWETTVMNVGTPARTPAGDRAPSMPGRRPNSDQDVTPNA